MIDATFGLKSAPMPSPELPRIGIYVSFRQRCGHKRGALHASGRDAARADGSDMGSR